MVRCATDGGIYIILNDQRVQYSPDSYTAAGNPAWIAEDCTQIAACPLGGVVGFPPPPSPPPAPPGSVPSPPAPGEGINLPAAPVQPPQAQQPPPGALPAVVPLGTFDLAQPRTGFPLRPRFLPELRPNACLTTASVMNVGATGAGVIDDSAAIAKAASRFSVVYFPPGTYRVSRSITIGVPIVMGERHGYMGWVQAGTTHGCMWEEGRAVTQPGVHDGWMNGPARLVAGQGTAAAARQRSARLPDCCAS